MKRIYALKPKLVLASVGLCVMSLVTILQAAPAQAAACVPPSPNLGVSSGTVSIKSAGTYAVTARMSAPNSTNNSLLMEVDGKDCYVVGDSTSMPVNTFTDVTYQNGQTTSKISLSLTTGSHTIKVYGREADVKLDYLKLAKTGTTLTFQAEQLTLSGNARTVSATGASGTAVQYTTAGPTGLRAVTGGPTMALQWDVSAGATGYQVFRNGTLIGTTTVNPSAYDNLNGNRYYDKTVAAGATYKYRIVAVTNNATSLPSSEISVTQPTATNTTAVPTVTLNYSEATDLGPWMETYVKPTAERWYPKIVDSIAGKAYAPPTAFTIKLSNSYTGIAQATATEVTISSAWARANPDSMSVIVHEITHIAQNFPATNRPNALVIEGGADWTVEQLYRSRPVTVPGPYATYNDGYANGAYFWNYMMTTYNKPAMLRDITISTHNSQYSLDLFKQQTGKSIEQMWLEMTGKQLSSTGVMVTYGNQCVDIPNSKAANGTLPQLYTCNGTHAQKFVMGFKQNNPANGGDLRIMGYCLDVKNSGNTVGTPVQLYACNGTNAQQWIRRSNDFSLYHPASGLCFDTAGASTTNGATFQLSACKAGGTQAWTVPNTFTQ